MSSTSESRSTRQVPFPATRWSVVIDSARQGSQSGVAEAAMTELFHDYCHRFMPSRVGAVCAWPG